MRCAVAGIKGKIPAGIVYLVAIVYVTELGTRFQLPGIRVQQQFVGIETISLVGLVGTMDPVSVACARDAVRQVAMPDLIGVFG
jgi:hypothetical protein